MSWIWNFANDEVEKEISSDYIGQQNETPVGLENEMCMGQENETCMGCL